MSKPYIVDTEFCTDDTGRGGIFAFAVFGDARVALGVIEAITDEQRDDGRLTVLLTGDRSILVQRYSESQ